MIEHLKSADLAPQKFPEQLELVDALPQRERQGAQARAACAIRRADMNEAEPCSESGTAERSDPG